MKPENEQDTLATHLTPDQVELCAGVPTGEVPDGPAAHLETCAECRREVTLFADLDRRLRALPRLDPGPAFAARVMGRVQLSVPWYRQAWDAARQRWVAVAAALAVLGATLGGSAYWLFERRELTPAGVLDLALEGARTLALRAAIALGRFLYDLGAVDLGRTLTQDVALGEAAIAMAALSLMGAGALYAMRRLMENGAPGLARTSRG